MARTMARQEHDLIVIDFPKSQRAGWLAIRSSHNLPARYFKTGKLGHSSTAYDCEHICLSGFSINEKMSVRLFLFRNPEMKFYQGLLGP
jgi:hypothetical protein